MKLRKLRLKHPRNSAIKYNKGRMLELFMLLGSVGGWSPIPEITVLIQRWFMNQYKVIQYKDNQRAVLRPHTVKTRVVLILRWS